MIEKNLTFSIDIVLSYLYLFYFKYNKNRYVIKSNFIYVIFLSIFFKWLLTLSPKYSIIKTDE